MLKTGIDDTIAAISTAMAGSGGIGIIRISGNQAIEIADKIFKSPGKKGLKEVESHTIHYGHLVNGKEIIDEVLISIMRAPKTYTKEDIVEINCHGGILVTQKVLDLVLQNGARYAEAGEFTKRAFLNGRIDLTEAEAVIDVINAQTNFSLKAASDQLNGRISLLVKELRNNLLDHIAFMEAAMDDPEHISMEGHLKDLEKDMTQNSKQIESLLKSFKSGQLMKEGITTVILGRTNAGKSSLLNLLTGTNTAIVTDIEGTTRDTVKEKVTLGGLLLNLVDTAGIRSTDDKVEAIGVKKAIKEAQNADLIIYVIDSSKELTQEDIKVAKELKNKKYIVLLNKADLNPLITEEKLKEIGVDEAFAYISFSAKEGIGLSELEEKVKEMFALGEILVDDSPIITNSRHKELLEESKKSIDLVKMAIKDSISEDLLTIDLMDAYTSLGYILGEEIEDDLADRIFEKFCMGK